MGFFDQIKGFFSESNEAGESKEDRPSATQFYKLGCEILGEPSGGYWKSSIGERADRINAGKKEYERRQRMGR